MRLANLFCDHMVLQAEKPVRFFGFGKGKIEVRINNKEYVGNMTTETWVFEIEAQDYGEPFKLIIRLNDDQFEFRNCVFGDVFLYAGQSNVQFSLESETPREPIVPNDRIRYYVSDRIENPDGLKSADGWRVCGDETFYQWSAIAYHTSESYLQEKGGYIGAIGCFQGASGIRSWLPKSVLDKSVYLPMEKMHGDYRTEPYAFRNRDSALYEHTFLPLAPFSFKGIIWYQGESDTTIEESKIYKEFLKRLIQTWRKDLDDEEMPFVIVQICDYVYRDDEGWKGIQKAQEEFAQENKGVFLVTSSDVCERDNIHPSNKRALSEKIKDVITKW